MTRKHWDFAEENRYKDGVDSLETVIIESTKKADIHPDNAKMTHSIPELSVSLPMHHRVLPSSGYSYKRNLTNSSCHKKQQLDGAFLATVSSP